MNLSADEVVSTNNTRALVGVLIDSAHFDLVALVENGVAWKGNDRVIGRSRRYKHIPTNQPTIVRMQLDNERERAR